MTLTEGTFEPVSDWSRPVQTYVVVADGCATDHRASGESAVVQAKVRKWCYPAHQVEVHYCTLRWRTVKMRLWGIRVQLDATTGPETCITIISRSGNLELPERLRSA